MKNGSGGGGEDGGGEDGGGEDGSGDDGDDNDGDGDDKCVYVCVLLFTLVCTCYLQFVRDVMWLPVHIP
jgi:hypothetical protein